MSHAPPLPPFPLTTAAAGAVDVLAQLQGLEPHTLLLTLTLGLRPPPCPEGVGVGGGGSKGTTPHSRPLPPGKQGPPISLAAVRVVLFPPQRSVGCGTMSWRVTGWVYRLGGVGLGGAAVGQWAGPCRRAAPNTTPKPVTRARLLRRGSPLPHAVFPPRPVDCLGRTSPTLVPRLRIRSLSCHKRLQASTPERGEQAKCGAQGAPMTMAQRTNSFPFADFA